MANNRIPQFVYPSVIIILTLLLYLNSIQNGFVNWDDDVSVITNTDIRSFEFRNIVNMFNNSYNGMYQPAVMLTFAVNYAIHGLQPEGYHFANLLFHLLNILLLFVFIRLLFKNTILATVTALIFAVHPMHVESVSWITERKDVLYAFFYLASLIMYVRYIQSEYNKKYLILTFIFFILSLFSKTNAVTLPLIIIAIDLYHVRPKSRLSIIEKAGLLLLSIVFGLIALKSQAVLSDGIFSNVHYTIIDRLFIACNAFVFYIIKFLVPINLSALYPFPLKPDGFLPLHYYLSIILFIAIVFGTVKLLFSNNADIEKLKHMKFAALFYMFSISIVVFIPVGKADVADRYTYIPYIGLTVFFYNLVNLFLKEKFKKFKLLILAFAVIVFSVITFQRNKIWKDSQSLWSDVIKKYPDSELAYYGRANFKQIKSDFHGALIDFNKAIELNPNYAMAYNNRGAVKLYLKDIDGALKDLNKSITLDPYDDWAYYNRALAFLNLNLPDPACKDLEQSARLGNINAIDLKIKFCKQTSALN